MSEPTLRPIWTPEDARQTAIDAARHTPNLGVADDMTPDIADMDVERVTRRRVTRRILAGIASGAILAGTFAMWVAAPAKADPPGCHTQFWLIPFQSNTRTICDGPVQPDGSWLRAREFWSPAYTAPARSSCSGGYRYSSCTYSPARFVPMRSQGIERYVVTPETVLADEPGHLA